MDSERQQNWVSSDKNVEMDTKFFRITRSIWLLKPCTDTSGPSDKDSKE